jgi:hypothetical protein
VTIKKILPEILFTALIAGAASLIVSFLYGLLRHGVGALEWETSIHLGIVLGITLPLVRHSDAKRNS